MTTLSNNKTPDHTDVFLMVILAFIALVMLVSHCSCTKPQMATPEKEPFPIDTLREVLPHGVIYHLWRSQPVDVVYHNPWDGSVLVLTWWCPDGDREKAVVGTGKICVDEDCIELR